MNLNIDEQRKVLCIIDEDKSEKELSPIYDLDNQDNLNLSESKYYHGKFYGWIDTENNIVYTKDKAYPKPELPFDLFGIECGEGWHQLLVPVLDYIKKYNEEHQDNPIIIEQIKEKFAELRIYVSYYTDELGKLIDTAVNKAAVTCEKCGTKEDVGLILSYWYTVACKSCVKKLAAERKLNYRWKSYSNNKVYMVTPEGEFIEETLKQ